MAETELLASVFRDSRSGEQVFGLLYIAIFRLYRLKMQLGLLKKSNQKLSSPNP